MKLLTHNFMASTILKGVKTGYPLGIEVRQVKFAEQEFQEDFLKRLLPKLDWPVVFHSAQTMTSHLPEGATFEPFAQLPEDWETNESFLKTAHRLLLEIDLVEGDLICPETGRKFPVNGGIPNMLLNEEEVGS